jgi:hypothetical protein
MSKQDIEKRLGFAAQGVKETTRTSAKAKFDREVGRKGNKSAMITKNGPDADASWLAYVVQHHGEGQGESVLGTMRSYSTEARAKAAALRGLETSGLRGGFARPGVKAEMAASDIIVKKDAQYIYYYPEDDDRATFPDDNGKGAYTVKSNRTGKPVSSKTYRSLQEAVSASNAMNEKLPPLKKAKASRPGVKAKMAKRMVVDTITSGNQKHELGYESVMQSLTAGEPPHEWFRPVVRTTNLDTGKSSEKASQPHYTEKSARDWLKNYASSVKPSTDPLYAEYASNREKISKMMTRLAQARNNPEMRQKLQAESDKLDARQREVAAQLQKRKSSRPGSKAKA